MKKYNETTLSIFLFLLLTVFFALQSEASTIDIPQTGQTTCYDVDGASVSCTGTGQDAEYRDGVAWPDPRFTDNGNGTVTDSLTGLVWLKNTSCFGPGSWFTALSNANSLASGACGLTDGSAAGQWRLPNRAELRSLIDHSASTPSLPPSNYFINVQTGQKYWTSTTYPANPASAWHVNINDGDLFTTTKTNTSPYIWPVRSGTAGAVQLPVTGQTNCYDSSGTMNCAGTGQDGEKLLGTALPVPRFAAGTGAEANCVTDNLGGLMWSQNANLPTATKTWQQALDYVASINSGSGLCGYMDWRLPNMHEFESLLHQGQSNLATWLNSQGFTNVQQDSYWSSTTLSSSPDNAWYAIMFVGHAKYYLKSDPYYVWPVRGGSGFYGSPVVQVTPSSPHSFGNSNSGSFSAWQTFTVQNNGTNNLYIGTISITGGDSGQFSIQNDNCSEHTVAPSGNCTIQARFSPSSAGLKNATLSIPSNIAGSPTDISMSGTGIQYALTVSNSDINKGTVTSNIGGINCGVTCVSSQQNPGTVIMLTATPAGGGAVFAGWSGGGCAGVGTCVTTLSSNITVTAIFVTPQTYTFSAASTTISENDYTYDGHNIVVGDGANAATLTVDGTHVFSGITIKNNGTLTHSATTLAAMNFIDLDVLGNIDVQAGGNINVNARGYVGGNQGGNDGSGQTTGNANGSTGAAGGSHGGLGGSGFSGAMAGAYDSMTDPVEPGGGGGHYSSGYGGSGGGLIRLTVGGALTNNGTISANGGGGAGYAGGGAGGGIYIAVGTLAGNGTITANGGNGTGCCSYANGGGGGGRIAAYYTNNTYGGTMYSYGGNGATSGGNGGAGTIQSLAVAINGSIAINSLAQYAQSTNVTLALTCTSTNGSCTQMQFSNDGSSYSAAEAYATTKAWTLSGGDGSKTVYARFKDNIGIWSLTYNSNITLDTIFPLVSLVTPTAGANNVPVGNPITVKFSEAMDGATINISTFTVGGVSGTVTYDGGTKTAVFVPLTDLSDDTLYTATVTTGATDLAGNAVASNYQWNFTTATGSFSVAASAGAGGSITPSGTVTVNKGMTQSFIIIPDAGYHISSASGCGGGLAGGVFITPPVTAACSVAASFELDVYTISASASTGGSISCGPSSVNYGDNTSCSITVDPGYYLSSLTDNTVSVTGSVSSSTYALSGITESHTIEASFSANPVNGVCGAASGQTLTAAPALTLCNAGTPSSVSGSGPWTWTCSGLYSGTSASCTANIQTYAVTASAGTGGSISPYTAQTVNHGSITSFTVTPDTGYSINSVTGCGVSLSGGAYLTAPITGNCTVSASFSANLVNGLCGASNGQTLTAAPASNLCSAGTPLSVSGSGPWTWTCQGQNSGTNASCSANIQTYALTVNTSGTGSGTVTGAGTYNHGQTVTVGATADASSVFSGWSGDCSGTGNPTTVLVNGTKTCTAAFTLKTYTVTTGAGPNGKITCTPATVNHGSSSICTITSDADYQVEDIEVDAVSIGKAATYSMSNITSDCTVTASFSIKKYDLSITKTGSGTVAVSPPGGSCGTDCFIYNKNQRVMVTAKAEKDSIFTGWSGACSGTGICQLAMSAEKSVTANFEAAAPVISVAPDGPQDFGNVRVGRLKTKTLKITNNGTGNLRITSIEIDGADSDTFSKRSGTAIIKPGKSSNLRVMFKPKSGETQSGTLRINSNDPVTPVVEIILTGAGTVKNKAINTAKPPRNRT